MEFGPRALGNRSILADPRVPSMKDRVNAKVKYREAFRPFAPVVTLYDASRFFKDSNSPFMMFTTQVGMDITLIPAVTHVDNTARIQTVTEASNIQLYRLLKAFENILTFRYYSIRVLMLWENLSSVHQ